MYACMLLMINNYDNRMTLIKCGRSLITLISIHRRIYADWAKRCILDILTAYRWGIVEKIGRHRKERDLIMRVWRSIDILRYERKRHFLWGLIETNVTSYT